VGFFDFLKDDLIDNTHVDSPIKVMEGDINGGKLDLNRFTDKFNCSWMDKPIFQEYPPRISIMCRNEFGLIEVAPNWRHRASLGLSFISCPNFKGGNFPDALDFLHIESCDHFSGKSLSDVNLDLVTIINCEKFDLANIKGAIRYLAIKNSSAGFFGTINCLVEKLWLHDFASYELSLLPKSLITLVAEVAPVSFERGLPKNLSRVELYGKNSSGINLAFGEFLIEKGFKQLESEGSTFIFSRPKKA
jgi:hypothetical protein